MCLFAKFCSGIPKNHSNVISGFMPGGYGVWRLAPPVTLSAAGRLAAKRRRQRPAAYRLLVKAFSAKRAYRARGALRPAGDRRYRRVDKSQVPSATDNYHRAFPPPPPRRGVTEFARVAGVRAPLENRTNLVLRSVRSVTRAAAVRARVYQLVGAGAVTSLLDAHCAVLAYKPAAAIAADGLDSLQRWVMQTRPTTRSSNCRANGHCLLYRPFAESFHELFRNGEQRSSLTESCFTLV